MPTAATSGGPGGIALALLTESFAVRALLGSLAAALLVGVAARLRLISSSGAKRLLLLAPVLTAAIAAAVTAMNDAVYLPRLWVMPTSTAGHGLVDLIDELGQSNRLNLLLVGYGVVVLVLLTRRALGAASTRSTQRRGRAPGAADRRAVNVLAGLAPRMGVALPRLVILPGCPGGAFAYGTLRPVIAVDPALAAGLDDRELEGLVAHELAHLRRRDNLLCLLVGLFRDLTFFLPAVSMAVRWLRQEQEESADEAAARCTGRPAALASSILKVWDRAGTAHEPAVCAAVPRRPALAAAGGHLPLRRGTALGDGTQLVTRRVERLIAGSELRSPGRRVAENGLAAAILALASMTALTVPAWIVDATGRPEFWAVGSLAGIPVTDAAEETPAFQTFHALTRSAPASSPVALTTAGTETAGCPCIETQSQLREGVAAVAQQPSGRLPWGRSVDLDTPTVEPLATFDQGARVGFYLVETPRRGIP